MSDDRARLAAIRAALAGVPAADLHQAAARLGGRWGELLGRVTTALDADGPDALRDALSGLPPVDQVEAELAPLRAAATDRVAALKGQLGAVRVGLDGLHERRDQLREMVAPLRQGTGDDPELSALLERAAALVEDPGLWTASAAVAARLERVLDQVARAPVGREADALGSVELTLEAGELAQEVQTLEVRVAPLFDQVPQLLDQAADLASARSHAAAPAVAVQAARVWESLSGVAAPEVLGRWQRAFDLGMAHEQLTAVWPAGKRLQASAVRDDDYKRVAVLAHHMAELACAQGARREAVLARMEEAQCLARWPEHHTAARTYLSDAVEIAADSDDPALRQQARLMQGQALELLGAPSEARKVYEHGLRAVRHETPPSGVTGRIALQLGRLRLTQGQHHRAGKALSLGLDAAVAQSDPVLLANVALPLVALALAQEQEDRAAQALRGVLARLGGHSAGGVLLAEAKRRWGESRVAGWLGSP
jgi:hypothetical protein